MAMLVLYITAMVCKRVCYLSIMIDYVRFIDFFGSFMVSNIGIVFWTRFLSSCVSHARALGGNRRPCNMSQNQHSCWHRFSRQGWHFSSEWRILSILTQNWQIIRWLWRVFFSNGIFLLKLPCFDSSYACTLVCIPTSSYGQYWFIYR
jgi:hypothetical protein